jgi:hypothetical protein
MQTVATYNDIVFYNVQTREFDEEVMYDASGTDYIGSRFKLKLEGEIHVQADVYNSALPRRQGIQSFESGALNNTGPTGLPKAFRWIQRKLAEPRKSFLLMWSKNGGQLIDADVAIGAHPAVAGKDPDGYTDCENGPKPRGLTVLRVTANSIKVQFAIEFFLSGCTQSGGVITGPFKIINNRWSIAESLDHDLFTTRRITGNIRFAEGLTHKHAFKAATIPGLEKGFRRIGIEYESSASGLEATYAVTDKQVHYAAPWPATSMEVTHSYSSNDAMTWLDQCDVTLYGSPDADRRLLLSRMVQIMDARVEGLRVVNDTDKQYMLENIVLTEHFGEQNFVNGTIVVKHFGESVRITLGNILDNKLGKPLELPAGAGGAYDATISTVPSVYGKDPHGQDRSPAFLFLLNGYHQDPCGKIKNIFGGSATNAPEDAGEQKESPPYPVQVDTGTIQQGNTSQYSPDQKDAMYTMAKVSNRYVTNKLRVMMPVVPGQDGISAMPVDLAPGATYRVIAYDAERVGQSPDIPELADSYTDGNIIGYLLKSIVEPQPPALAADGHKRVFRVKVTACYGLNRAVTDQDLACGKLPFTAFQSGDTHFSLSQTQKHDLLV